MKSFSIFILLIYWSILILAPVVSKENKIFIKETSILPKNKPNK
jgi:hypothetical protein